ncbi:DUF3364 domain-containing protein [Salipiger thiooxidans]|uniref:DUF3364 domain-containing protein n=1 Tax=Salipiger thiooxidans TaxID=282683 RepID=UPI001F5FFEF9|nr:DUF3364 domain-containing protein [Salipiger thiooxidans]
MSQSADKVLDHAPLFQQPEYKDMLANKKVKSEYCHPDEMCRRSATGQSLENTARRTSPARRSR